ncbi:MAG: zinc ribbon domain-containing protein [Nitrospira sp.]|nr:zinc ribbon domain-containing protein [Nitrospira sp.]MDH5496250.1 zinc ribbon domain-containing protein [Nitrospira sp.]MDH5725008.1 zinc ribbon domain-containing protein [Nitrospira sp.]
MPIYEYVCGECHRRSSILVLNSRQLGSVRCRHCGGSKMERLLSRFASPKSEETRLESLMDPTNIGNLDENDPKSVARMMKKMGEDMGEDTSDIEEALLAETSEGEETSDQTDGL